MISTLMYKHQDPLNKAYTQLIRESGHEDYRQQERDKSGYATKPIKQPGIHVHNVEEVVLTNKDILPGEVEFIAEWGNDDYEHPEGRARIRTHDAGFTINVTKIYIPATTPQAELDEWTGKPGVYTPGMNLLPFIVPGEVERITDNLTEDFNDTRSWGSTSHYLPDRRDNV